MNLLDAVSTRLESAPGYRSQLCETGYADAREHCTTCGAAAVTRASSHR